MSCISKLFSYFSKNMLSYSGAISPEDNHHHHHACSAFVWYQKKIDAYTHYRNERERDPICPQRSLSSCTLYAHTNRDRIIPFLLQCGLSIILPTINCIANLLTIPIINIYASISIYEPCVTLWQMLNAEAFRISCKVFTFFWFNHFMQSANFYL